MIRRIFDTLAIVLFVALWPALSLAQVTKITPAPGGSSTITIDSTAISGGATTQVLYNAAGVVSSDSGFTRGSGTTTISNGVAAVSPLVVKDNATTQFEIADGGTATFAQGVTLSSGATVGANAAIGFGGMGYIYSVNGLTPVAPTFATNTTAESWHFMQVADVGVNMGNGACGAVACTDPSFIIHSAVQDTTQYNHLAVWGQAGGGLKALTAAAATALVRIPITQGAATGGSLRYTIIALDATDQQSRSGEIKFAVVNKAGTETCTVSAASEAADGSVAAVSVGTLTYGIACTSNAADTVDLTINAVSSLTETTLQARYFVTLVGTGQPARQ